MKYNPINIAFVVDEGYTKYFFVSLKSIIDHTNEYIRVFVLCNSSNTMTELKKNAIPLENAEIQYIVPNTDRINFGSRYFSGYLKYLLIDNIDVDHLLYLDCDLLALGNISEIWNKYDENYSIMAVWNPLHTKDHDLIGISHDKHTFNSGVMLLNLKRMRQKKAFEKLVEFTWENLTQINNNDQTVFNCVFKDDWVELPLKYNFQTILLRRRASTFNLTKSQYNEIVKNTIIIHFSGRDKPWKFKTNHKFKKHFIKYYKLCFGRMNYSDKISIRTCLFKFMNILAQIYYKYISNSNSD